MISPAECSMHTWEKNIYYVSVCWNNLYIFVGFLWCIVFKSTVSLLISCPINQSIIESSILNFPTIIVFLAISYFSSTNVCFIYLGFWCWVYIFLGFLSLYFELIILSLSMFCFSLVTKYIVCFMSILPKISIVSPVLFWLYFHGIFFAPLHVQPVYVFKSKVSFL